MTRSALAVHGTLSRGVLAVTFLVSLAVLFTPGDDVPPAFFGVDKVVHVVLFAALAVAGRWAGVPARLLALLLTGYALVSEVVQALAPLDRSGSVGDWLADVLGVALGLLAWAGIARGRASR
ncbi:VanZ family protein [Trujillonella humicola]|uniref:VanZ family protein n=1 Tax=Trujillonella humicola TaxID=3383699 RepID=UPI0039060CDC